MNADKVAPGVMIKLGGKERKLVFDMWAFYLLEQNTGKNALNGELFSNPSLSDLMVLIWAALQGSEKDLSLEQVGRMMSFEDLPMLSKAIQEAFKQVSIPETLVKKSPENEGSEPQ